MKLTPEKIAEHYDWLLQTVPFRDQKMPDRNRMVFKTTKDKRKRGYFRPLSSGWVIAISEDNHRTQAEVQATVAHEMIHANIEMILPSAPHHGAWFQEMADEICEYFGFDREKF